MICVPEQTMAKQQPQFGNMTPAAARAWLPPFILRGADGGHPGRRGRPRRRGRPAEVTAPVRGGYFRQVSPARKPSDLRASDDDRERVVALLAAAAADGRLTLEEHSHRVQRAYQARTLGELASLTTDLAPAAGQPLLLDDSRSVTAFFATTARDGRWVVPDRLTVTAVGGKVILDMRDALLQGMHTVLHATLIGGQLHLLVPDRVQVVVTGPGHPGRGGPDVARHQVATAPSGSRLIEIRAFTVAGRVQVHAPRRPGARWRDRFPRRPTGLR
jgi:Domain of unknown function (DUF1707)